MCICITQSLCCTSKTNTTVLINYTPIKNKKIILRYIRNINLVTQEEMVKCGLKGWVVGVEKGHMLDMYLEGKIN